MKTFLFTYFLLISSLSHAQSLCSEKFPVKNLEDFFVETNDIFASAKPTSQDSRIIAIGQSRYNGNAFNFTDSTRLFYSGNRGGDYARQLKYDSLYTFLFNTSSNTYGNSRRNYQTFDSKDNLLSRQIQTWSNNSWINLSLNEYTYDNSDNQISSVSKNWNTSANSWKNIDSAAFSYDAANNLMDRTLAKWNQNSWINYSQTLYTYNSNNDLLSALYKIWNQGTWKDTLRDLYSFDANYFLISHTQQIYRNGSWEDTILISYANVANGNILSQTLQKMAQGNWMNVSKVTYAYNSNNQQTSALNQSWNNSTQSWDTVSGYNLAYDMNGNLVKEEYQTWNSTANSLINTKRFRHIYNSFNQVTETWRDTWNINTANWEYAVNDQASRYHYEIFTSVESISAESSKFLIYPSPAYSHFIIEATVSEPSLVILSDIFGRVLKKWNFNNHFINRNLSTDFLEQGYYTITLINNTEKISRKIFVIK